MKRFPSFRFRDYTPRGFYARSLLIVILPLVLLLLVMSIVFFESHIRQVSRKLSQTMAGDAATIAMLYERGVAAETLFAASAGPMRLPVQILEDANLPPQKPVTIWQRSRDGLLRHELNVSLEDRPFSFDIDATTTQIAIFVRTRETANAAPATLKLLGRS